MEVFLICSDDRLGTVSGVPHHGGRVGLDLVGRVGEQDVIFQGVSVQRGQDAIDATSDETWSISHLHDVTGGDSYQPYSRAAPRHVGRNLKSNSEFELYQDKSCTPLSHKLGYQGVSPEMVLSIYVTVY